MILCAGESLVDVVPQADGSRLALPGGAVFNTALGLGRLGADVAYLWPLSTDDHGRRLRALLDGAGVDTGPCPATDLPTASAEVTLSDGNATYVFHLVGTTATALTPQPLPAAARALFIGGISLAIEPAATAIETLATDAARAGLTVMIDPNLRPGLIDDPEALRARLEAEVAARAGPAGLTRPRHRAALSEAVAWLERLEAAPLPELRAEALRGALHALARLSGRVNAEAVLDLVFSEFCIGK